MKKKICEVKDSGTGVMLSAGDWKHPLSYEEAERLKEQLRRLLNQPMGYDSFEVLLPEDGGTESIVIDRENAYKVYVELKKMLNN